MYKYMNEPATVAEISYFTILRMLEKQKNPAILEESNIGGRAEALIL